MTELSRQFWDTVIDSGIIELAAQEREIVVTTAAEDAGLVDAIKWALTNSMGADATDYGFGSAIDAVERKYEMTTAETDTALNLCENNLKDTLHYDET